MSHYFDTGFSVRENMWHGLGNVLDEYPENWAQVRQQAGWTWDPTEEPLYEIDQAYPDDRHTVKVVEGWKQVKRSDTGGRLNVCMQTYQVVDFDTMGQVFEAIMDGSGQFKIKCETAGSLQDGRKVWALALIGDAFELPGDPSPVQPYFALLNSFDGMSAFRAITTAVRIVCWNTWHLADMEATRGGRAFSFRHTKNVKQQVAEAKRALTTSEAQINATIEQAKEILRVKANAHARKRFVEEFAIHRVITNTAGRRRATKATIEERMRQPRVQEALTATMDQLNQILGSRTCDGIRDTAWGLVQAGLEYLDHIRPANSEESRFSRSMLDDRDDHKVTVMNLAREVTR